IHFEAHRTRQRRRAVSIRRSFPGSAADRIESAYGRDCGGAGLRVLLRLILAGFRCVDFSDAASGLQRKIQEKEECISDSQKTNRPVLRVLEPKNHSVSIRLRPIPMELRLTILFASIALAGDVFFRINPVAGIDNTGDFGPATAAL